MGVTRMKPKMIGPVEELSYVLDKSVYVFIPVKDVPRKRAERATDHVSLSVCAGLSSKAALCGSS